MTARPSELRSASVTEAKTVVMLYDTDPEAHRGDHAAAKSGMASRRLMSSREAERAPPGGSLEAIP